MAEAKTKLKKKNFNKPEVLGLTSLSCLCTHDVLNSFETLTATYADGTT